MAVTTESLNRFLSSKRKLDMEMLNEEKYLGKNKISCI
jgi:hypothetical protein